MACSSAQVAARARRLAGPVVSAGQASALPLEEPAAWDEVVAPRRAAARDVAAAPQQEVAAWAEAEEPQQEVAWVGAAVRRPEAVRQGAWGAPAAPLRGAQPSAPPSAAPWVFRRDQALPWPAPQPAARFARAMQGLQIALP